MFLSIALALIVAVPPASSPTPRALKTIVTVVSSPYCNALEQHFNSALVPMLANDRVFDVVDVQLGDMNDMFKYPDYANRFLDLRYKIIKESGTLDASLKAINDQIFALHQSASLTNDSQAAQQMRDAADRLRDAYVHQFQLSTDLTGLAHSMMQYNPLRGPHPLGGWTPYENTLPSDAKDIKSYLEFDSQRQSIDQGEDKAVDIAYTAATTHCTTSPSPQPTK
ncbi:MAG: hypothetical protein JO092_10690 [Candidatus Eremiobacteraeota bacterium]|nr:hypothetical protein [Candidatus Eremiobacteraeota bacterium]